MKIGRATELQCPRCRVVATRRPGRQERCTHCGARLVAAQSPSEDRVRAYLYDGASRQVPDEDAIDAVAGPA